MSTTPAEDSQQLKLIIARIDGDETFSEGERLACLELLEDYECWGPYFRLIRKRLNDPKNCQTEDYIRLAKVQNQNLEDVFAAAETAANLVSDRKISYQEFQERVVPQIIDFEDFASEAAILSAVSERFAVIEDRVKCLERLCMLYEKRTHNESQLLRTYEHLLKTDERNVKALRFFKLVHTQNGEWDEVVQKLRLLLECVQHKQEIFRYAQELAAVYLYQLDQPDQAIKVIDTYCANSPLDTSTIQYDAYQALSDLPGCLKLLRQCLLGVNDDISRSTLHFKMAAIHEQLNENDKALENYEKSALLWPTFLDATEGVITLLVEKGDWKKLQEWIARLQEHVVDERLKVQLGQAVKRIEDGMTHAR